MVARLKLKGIDGRAPPGVELAAQFDSTRGILLGSDVERIDRLNAFSRFYGWWCMAVLSPWSDLSGQFRKRTRFYLATWVAQV